jgi:hypothetical protein
LRFIKPLAAAARDKWRHGDGDLSLPYDGQERADMVR